MTDDRAPARPVVRETFYLPRTWATLVACGSERQSWLNGLVTCDVAKLEPGSGVWGLVLTRTGKIQCPVVVVATADHLDIGVPVEKAQPVFDFLEERLVMEDVDLLKDDSATWFTVHGSQAEATGARLRRNGISSANLHWTEAGDIAAVVRPIAGTSAEEHWKRLCGDIGAGTEEQWDALRIRSGFPALGVDYSERDNPHEAALERRAVSWSKGCYVGQEVVCMQDMRGKVKRRISLVGTSAGSIAHGDVVTSAADGKTVGSVTSATERDGGGGLALVMLESRDGPPMSLHINGVPAEILPARF